MIELNAEDRDLSTQPTQAPETGGESTGEAEPQELDRLKEELNAKTVEAAEYLENLQRLKAEFENFKKRMLREQTQFVEMATQGLVERLLSVVDNFERALYTAEETREIEPLLRGVEMVYAELRALLENEGLREVEAQDELFDPEVHEAVMQVHAEGVPENQVIDVLRKGYRLKGRLLRPAMVKVAKDGAPRE